MSKFRFKVKDIGEITGRGRVITGDILDGIVRIGDRLRSPRTGPLVVTGVEFADNTSKHEYHVALVFAHAPALAELRSVLSAGAVLEAAE